MLCLNFDMTFEEVCMIIMLAVLGVGLFSFGFIFGAVL